MPKQRNHPHHHGHSQGQQEGDGEFELPQPRFSAIWRGYVYDYPKRWVTRPVAGSMGRLYVVALCAAGALLLLAVVFSLLVGGH